MLAKTQAVVGPSVPIVATAVLMDILAGLVTPTMAMAKVPLLTGAVHGNTEGAGPFADLMRRAKQLEQRQEVLSISMSLVQPFLTSATARSLSTRQDRHRSPADRCHMSRWSDRLAAR